METRHIEDFLGAWGRFVSNVAGGSIKGGVLKTPDVG